MSGEAARDVMRVCEELRVVCTDLQRHVTKRIYPLAVEMEQPLPKPFQDPDAGAAGNSPLHGSL